MSTTTPRIGIVLSSGGARGIFAHTGFLLGLEQLGVPAHAFAGCSAGAVVGGVVASGTVLRDWTEAIAAMRPSAFWRPYPWWHVAWRLAVRQGRGYTGLSSPERAIHACRAQLSAQTFEACPRPFRAVAYSLSRSRKVVFEHGSLAERMIASAAMPVLYEPVPIDGDWYSDGAIVEFDPIDAICCRHGLDLVIVHHVATRREGREQLNAALQARWPLLRLLDWVIYRQHPWYVTGERQSVHFCPSGCRTGIVVLAPTLPDLPWPAVDGGPAIQASALDQTIAALGPITDRLLTDPRRFVADHRASAPPRSAPTDALPSGPGARRTS